MFRYAFLIMLVLLPAGVGAEEPLRVLFVGNSYTYANDLPGVLRKIVEAGKVRQIRTQQLTPGGASFETHWKDRQVIRLLGEKTWDVVILQGQSQRPSFPKRQRLRQVDSYAKQLAAKIRVAKAEPLLFMTWGYRKGDRHNFKPDTYRKMQERLRIGYTEIARACGGKVAPVGMAWQKALAKKKGLDLWVGDGSHPNVKGTYLAACVFYKILVKKSPVGNPHTAGLDPAMAKFLQEVATSVAP